MGANNSAEKNDPKYIETKMWRFESTKKGENDFYILNFGDCKAVMLKENVEDGELREFLDENLISNNDLRNNKNVFSNKFKGKKLYFFFESDFENTEGKEYFKNFTHKCAKISNLNNMEEVQELNYEKNQISFPSYDDKYEVTAFFTDKNSKGEENDNDTGRVVFYTLNDIPDNWVDVKELSNDARTAFQLNLAEIAVAMIRKGIFDDGIKLKIYKDNDASYRGYLFLTNSKNISQTCKNKYLRGNNLEELYENAVQIYDCNDTDKELIQNTKKRFEELYTMLENSRVPEPEPEPEPERESEPEREELSEQ